MKGGGRGGAGGGGAFYYHNSGYNKPQKMAKDTNCNQIMFLHKTTKFYSESFAFGKFDDISLAQKMCYCYNITNANLKDCHAC